mmetsp:Transcript_18125/g.43197  ORF Transcript_18125/g.43197 Transcript_18125/m.43197 type:complete len:150 (-) Transcript_18125:460-909(-)
MIWDPPFQKLDSHLSLLDKFQGIKSEIFSNLILNYAGGKKKLITLYIGNLSYLTREEQLWALFSQIGELKRVIMGIHRYNLTPCGFCFIEFYYFSDSYLSLLFLSGFKLDGRLLRIDLDEGFVDGRQYGRGKRGGQIGDELKRKSKKGK